MSTAKRKKRSSSLKGSLNPSKRHRDRFNVELDNLAKLLPFPNDVIQKLDKLSILRLSASYLRAKNFFKEQHWTDTNNAQSGSKAVAKKDFQLEGNGFFSKLLLEALDGFVIVLTQDFELFYASETIQDYLGLSQSSVIHQDFLRFIHVDDHDLIKRNLQPLIEDGDEKKIKILDDENDGDPSRTPKREEEASSETGSISKEVHTERTFICRMKCILNTSAGFFKPFKCNGRLREMTLPDSDKREYGLFLICTPMETTSTSILEIRLKTSLFCSKNRMDLSFVDIDQKGRALLGYHKRDIALQSSYCMIHFEDIAVLKQLHVDLMSTGKCQGTFRILNKNMKWQWLTGTAQVVFKGNEPDFVITTNRPLSEEEGEEVLRQRGQHTPALQFTTADNNISPKDNSGFPYFMDASKNNHEFKYPGVPPKFFPATKKKPQPPSVNTGNGIHNQGYFNRGRPSSGTDGTLSPQANLSSFSDDGFSSTACTSAPDSPDDLDLGVDLQDVMTDGSDFTFLAPDFPLGDPDPAFNPATDSDLVDHMSHLVMDPTLGELPTLEETLALMQDCISSGSDSTTPSLTSPDGSFVSSAQSPPHVNCDPFSPTSSVGHPSPFVSPVGSQVSGPPMMSPSGLPTPDASPLGRREGDPARVNISWQGVSKARTQNQMQQQQQQYPQQQHSPYGQYSPNYQPNMNPNAGNVLSSKSAYMAAVKKREMENYSSCVGNSTNSIPSPQNMPQPWRVPQCSPTPQQANIPNNYNNWNSGYQQGYRAMNPVQADERLVGNVQAKDPAWNQGTQGGMTVPPFEDTLPNLDYPGSNVLSPPYPNEGMSGYGFPNKKVPVTSVSTSKLGGW